MILVNDLPQDCNLSYQAILNFVNQTDTDNDINIKTCSILYNGKDIIKFCNYPYNFDQMQLMFSMTKTVTALAIGIAIDKEYFNLNDRIVNYFQDKLPEFISDNLLNIRVKDLLTMTSGIKENTYNQIYPQVDWIKAFLHQEFPCKPGSYYRYSTHAGHMLSDLIYRTTEKSLLEFLKENLFDLLDIEKVQWELGPDGIITGGMGLSLYPNDINKLAILLLNKGIYNGNRIISEEYIRNATAPLVYKQSEISKKNNSYCGMYFGYQIHVGQNDYFRMDGAYGQTCVIAPDKNLIVTVTSAKSNKNKLIKYIYEELLLTDQKNINEQNKSRLKNKLMQLNKSVSYNVNTFNHIGDFFGNYTIADNHNGIKKITLSNDNSYINLSVLLDDEIKYDLIFDYEKPYHGTGLFIKDVQNHLQSYISYISSINLNEMHLKVIYLETPYIVNYKLTFNNKTLVLDFKINCSFTLKSCKIIGYLDS